MCGVSGSGKTEYSRTLEADGFVRVSSDEIIWEEYGDAFASMPIEKQQAVFASTGEKLIAETVSLLRDGRKVVVDSTMCKRNKRLGIADACRQEGVEPIFVFLKADYPLLCRRLSNRRGQGPNDQIVPEERLMSFCKNFEVPDDDEAVVIVEQM